MSVEQAVYATISPAVSGRAYNGTAPQNVATPWLGYTRISTAPVHNAQRAMGGGLTNYRFQVDVMADDLDQARSTADAVVLALDAAQSAAFQVVWLNQFESEEDAPSTAVVVLEFSVWHTP